MRTGKGASVEDPGPLGAWWCRVVKATQSHYHVKSMAIDGFSEGK